MKRRDFIKLSAAIPTFTPSLAFSTEKPINETPKINCNFCSVGCHGDLKKDLFCIKGYSNFDLDSKQRIKTPLLRMKDGKFDKNGKLTPVTWDKAFEIMSFKARVTTQKFGPNGVGLFTSGNLGVVESYALNKFFRAGLRSNNIYNTNHYTAYPSMVASVQVFGNDGVYGNFEDIFKSDITISWGSNLAETYPVLFSKILQKQSNDPHFKFINISTFKNKTSDFATLNILIQPNSDEYLLKYLLKSFLEKNEHKLDWNLIKRRFIFAKLHSTNHTKLDELEQWEISYKEYKKSLEPYTLEYIVDKIKAQSEEKESFIKKLKLLSDYFNNFDLNISSLWSAGINKQKNAINLNVLLYSLHLISNKHSRPGCAMLSLTGQSNTLMSTTILGNLTHRLPANMYVKYKEHREKCENIWNIPNGTLNPEANSDQNQLLENIQTNKTKFLWIVGSNPYKSTPYLKVHINNLNNNQDIFVVTSDYFLSESAKLSDLILPTAMPFEKETIHCNNDRKLHFTPQQKEPFEKSMSELWQVLELSRYIELQDVWNLNKIDENTLLVNVIGQLNIFNYEPNDSLYRILFNNKRTKRYKLNNKNKNHLNTEVKGDSRDILAHNSLLFFGYRYYIQNYLYDEMSKFFMGVGYDLPPFDKLQNQDYSWPYIYNKEIKYRFNPHNDFYAKKASQLNDQYIFYGNMGGKTISFGNFQKITSEDKEELKFRAKIFTTPHSSKEKQKNSFYLHQIKVLEHVNTGTITNNSKHLSSILNQSYCYMSKHDMKALSLKNNDLVLLSKHKNSVVLRAIYDKRFDLEKKHLAIANYGNNISLNHIVTSLSDSYVEIQKWTQKNV
jgi:nitrate reductase NapA